MKRLCAVSTLCCQHHSDFAFFSWNVYVGGRNFIGSGLSGRGEDNPCRQCALAPQLVRRFCSPGGRRSLRRGCRLMIQCLAATSLPCADGGVAPWTVLFRKCALNVAYAPSVGNTKADDARSSSGAAQLRVAGVCFQCYLVAAAPDSPLVEDTRQPTVSPAPPCLVVVFFLLSDRLQFSNDRSCLSQDILQRMSHEFGERDKTCRCSHAHFDFEGTASWGTQPRWDTTACAPTEPATKARPSRNPLCSKTKAAPVGLGVSPARAKPAKNTAPILQDSVGRRKLGRRIWASGG